MTSNRQPVRGAFTLVELLVVIAIIGILVALLLPAVQAARESARRLQCKNKVKQITLAIQNFESANKTYPTGGTFPWPRIEDYSSNGSPNGAARQGLSWAFQVLPYLEENAAHDINTTTQMEQTPIDLYFCPSRRPPVFSPWNSWLIDYATATTSNRVRLGNVLPFEDIYLDEDMSFWGCGNCIWNVLPVVVFGYEYRGIIVRTDWDQRPDPNTGDIYGAHGNTPPTTVAQITDGLSHTLLVGEKRLASERYQTGDWHDDKGWADGWDPDTIRSTAFPVRMDLAVPEDDQELSASSKGSAARLYGFCFGSAHPGGINISLGDGSVRTINYDIDPVLFDDLGNRSDGNVRDLSEIGG